MREWTRFELRIEELGLTSGRQLMRTFEMSLSRDAKEWIEHSRHRPLLGQLYRRAKSDDASDMDCMLYFRMARLTLMERVGIPHENLGESSVRAWEKLDFPENPGFREDLDDWLVKATNCYNDLVQMGQHRPGVRVDELKMVTDLSNKVPKRTDFRR